jgi:carboxyl-terminal processing protease
MADSARGYRIALILSTLFLVVAAFGAGWVGSWLLQRADVGLTLPGGQRIGAAAPAPAAGEPLDGEFSLFWEAMGLLDAHFYAQESLPQGPELTYAAVEGIVQATGDPHTSFMDPERAEMVAESLEGEFEGIGAAVEMTEQGLVIVTPFPGTPADQAGLLPGDLVVEVDGTFTQGLDVMEAVSMVRGPEGTQVTLMVRREGVPDLLSFEITRARVVTPTVETQMIEEEGMPAIGYIRLFDFGGHSVEQFNAALQELLDQGAERLIVDLRNNSGGYLRASV